MFPPWTRLNATCVLANGEHSDKGHRNVASVAECLPSLYKALGFILRTTETGRSGTLLKSQPSEDCDRRVRSSRPS